MTTEYQQRVVNEKNELDVKLSKLMSFLESETYRKLPADERSRLQGQAHHMAEYSKILGERITAFV